MKDIKYKEGEWQSLSEGIVLLTSSSLFQWITEADRISEDAKSSCDTYDVDHAIDIDTASNTNYEETEHRLTLLQQAIQHVPDTLSGRVDQPFYNVMDSLMEKLSNMNIMGYETMARGSFSNGVNSAGVAMPKMKVTLEDLLGNSSPLTDYLRVEYNQMKQQIGDVSFEEYKNMAFVDTSFDYYSRNEEIKDLAVTLVINGAVLVIGGTLPWPLMVALGLTSGGKNISDAWRGKDLFTGKDLSTGDRILRGLSGIADVALAGYGTYKGLRPRPGTTKVVVSEKASGANQKVISELESPVLDGQRVGSGATVDDVNPIWGKDQKGRPVIEKEFPHVPKEHGFPDIVDNYPTVANEFPLVGGDGVNRRFFQIEGSNNGKTGVFEWIVEPNGNISHRRFIDGGVLTGKPNQVPKK
ncbi:pre-toxin TG domain-containing protein [Enterococcus plantarum]|uniref:pre-toxin TG domain-containing protein n=1 Tax=Enterococcus plantarum TaxID=1077675 RepID=UPI001A8F1D90|nr:pre-toxin TG domain-containing protein [Enterococcus plantarum]MBO0424012.1 hypothetical protein [Enterococcus plantarum]